MGAPQEVVDEAKAESDRARLFEVWEENWPVLQMFLRIQTQWNVHPMGGYVGMNYQSAEFAFKIYNVKNRREMLEGLQTIEFEVLKVVDETKSKKG